MTDALDDSTMADLMFMALDHATDSVVSSGGPLTPFVMTERDGERSLARFVAETLEEGLARAREAAASEHDAYTVVAFDGYLTDGQGRHDAIYVEAVAPNGTTAALAQRYRIEGRLRKKVVPFGNPTRVGYASKT